MNRRKSILSGAAVSLLMGNSAGIARVASGSVRKTMCPDPAEDSWRRNSTVKSASRPLPTDAGPPEPLSRESTASSNKRSRGSSRRGPGSVASSPAVSRNSSAKSTDRSPANVSRGGGTRKLCCDKCDKAHETASCPYYKKGRDKHPDAQKRRHHDFGEAGGNFVLKRARVVKQPGDGSCLFHSIAYGLRQSGVSSVSANQLRRQIAQFVERNATMKISESPLGDWVKWDTGISVSAYARRMMSGNYWGGGIEIASAVRMNKVNIHVYEVSRSRRGGGFKRISCFNFKGAKHTIHILYTGGIHYDALSV